MDNLFKFGKHFDTNNLVKGNCAQNFYTSVIPDFKNSFQEIFVERIKFKEHLSHQSQTVQNKNGGSGSDLLKTTFDFNTDSIFDFSKTIPHFNSDSTTQLKNSKVRLYLLILTCFV